MYSPLPNKEEKVIALEARKEALERVHGKGSYTRFRPWNEMHSVRF